MPPISPCFPRFHGGYRPVFGGWAGDAYVALTGGVSERVDLARVDCDELYSRVSHALQGGAVIAASAKVRHERDQLILFSVHFQARFFGPSSINNDILKSCIKVIKRMKHVLCKPGKIVSTVLLEAVLH